MKISVLTLFPQLYEPFFQTSLIKRAQERGDLICQTASLLAHCAPKERIDGPTFGHGPGMLIRPEVVERAVEAQERKQGKAFKVFFSPHGTMLDQQVLAELYQKIVASGNHCMLLPARYEGMDARVEDEYADALISMGNFVLMGGDIPALAFIEAIARLVPGVVGREESVERESFSGPFVDFPQFTAPAVWRGREVPEVMRSGNHGVQQEWSREQAAQRTVQRHFGWLRRYPINDKDRDLGREFIPPHYAVLMHSEVMLPDRKEGVSSVTSIDIHDIARSAKTYGLRAVFIVTPLLDQQKIVQKLLSFWKTGEGIEYNPSRHEAVSSVFCLESLDKVLSWIEEKEGKRPACIATSAREVAHAQTITYYDQEKVWKECRPVLFIFGTAQGLAPSVVNRCNYLLLPVRGFSSFNHLSVRSAAAIVFDRWLGINEKQINGKVIKRAEGKDNADES